MPRANHHTPAPGLLQVIRRRASGRLRMVVLSIFALGIAMQALLGVLGGIHESTAPAHAMHGMDGHAEHMAPHDHAAAVRDGTDADEGGPLHVLLHFTHCCGHSTWMAGGDTVPAAPVPMRAAAPLDRSTALPAPDLTAPFRPPIAV